MLCRCATRIPRVAGRIKTRGRSIPFSREERRGVASVCLTDSAWSIRAEIASITGSRLTFLASRQRAVVGLP